MRNWIATGPSGKVLHLSTHDGWTVEEVTGNFPNGETPETDAAAFMAGDHEVVMASFARAVERRLREVMRATVELLR